MGKREGMLLISLVDLGFLVLAKNNMCIVRSLVTNMPSTCGDHYSMSLGALAKNFGNQDQELLK